MKTAEEASSHARKVSSLTKFAGFLFNRPRKLRLLQLQCRQMFQFFISKEIENSISASNELVHKIFALEKIQFLHRTIMLVSF